MLTHLPWILFIHLHRMAHPDRRYEVRRMDRSRTPSRLGKYRQTVERSYPHSVLLCPALDRQIRSPLDNRQSPASGYARVIAPDTTWAQPLVLRYRYGKTPGVIRTEPKGHPKRPHEYLAE